MLLWNTKLHFAQREDALGEFNGGNLTSTQWIIRTSTIALAKAILASKGHTHQNDRWTIRLLEDNRDAIPMASELIQIISGRPISHKSEVIDWTTFCDSLVADILGAAPELMPVFMHVLAAFPITTAISND